MELNVDAEFHVICHLSHYLDRKDKWNALLTRKSYCDIDPTQRTLRSELICRYNCCCFTSVFCVHVNDSCTLSGNVVTMQLLVEYHVYTPTTSKGIIKHNTCLYSPYSCVVFVCVDPENTSVNANVDATGDREEDHIFNGVKIQWHRSPSKATAPHRDQKLTRTSAEGHFRPQHLTRWQSCTRWPRTTGQMRLKPHTDSWAGKKIK